MGINKVQYGNTVLIDLTSDTVSVSDVVSGVTFHLRDGSIGTGTLPNGNSLEYGYTDGSLPLVGIAKVDSAHVWDDQLQMMIFGTGQIGTGRVV